MGDHDSSGPLPAAHPGCVALLACFAGGWIDEDFSGLPISPSECRLPPGVSHAGRQQLQRCSTVLMSASVRLSLLLSPVAVFGCNNDELSPLARPPASPFLLLQACPARRVRRWPTAVAAAAASPPRPSTPACRPSRPRRWTLCASTSIQVGGGGRALGTAACLQTLLLPGVQPRPCRYSLSSVAGGEAADPADLSLLCTALCPLHTALCAAHRRRRRGREEPDGAGRAGVPQHLCQAREWGGLGVRVNLSSAWWAAGACRRVCPCDTNMARMHAWR